MNLLTRKVHMSHILQTEAAPNWAQPARAVPADADDLDHAAIWSFHENRAARILVDSEAENSDIPCGKFPRIERRDRDMFQSL